VRKIDALKSRLPLPELLVRLGLFSSPPGSGSHRCPLHGEVKGAAFSITHTEKSWLWNCYGACGGGGDEITLIERHLGVPRWGAIRHYAALCGDAVESPQQAVNTKPREVLFPGDLRLGTRTELEAVAALRKVNFWAVAAMQQGGVLRFGTVCGQPCWIVTDPSRLCAEARRLDGKWFEASGKLGSRKAHTLPGSVKNWPVGLLLDGLLNEHFKKVLWVEGSGDLAAGYHFAVHSADWLPVAMLGASMKQLHPEALQWLKGRQVRLVPHADTAGRSAADRWGGLLDALGCPVDVFELEGLRCADGSPVKDLNDCTDLHPDHQSEIKALLK
jgi:hypothetical protein